MLSISLLTNTLKAPKDVTVGHTGQPQSGGAGAAFITPWKGPQCCQVARSHQLCHHWCHWWLDPKPQWFLSIQLAFPVPCLIFYIFPCWCFSPWMLELLMMLSQYSYLWLAVILSFLFVFFLTAHNFLIT